MPFYFPNEDEITLTTATTATFIPFDSKNYYTWTTVLPYEEHKHIKYFNCKRCGAVGQQGVCKYCGSAEEGESNEVN